MKTIMNTYKGVCYLCGSIGPTENHHIFPGVPNRRSSEKYGLKVYLCPYCHRLGPKAVHNCKATMDEVKRDGQRAFERVHGSRKQFMNIFGKNWLGDDE